MEKDEDDRKVNFAGATISTVDANRAGLALFFGGVGAAFSVLVFGANKIAAHVAIAILAVAGFVLGCRVFKRKS
jgi:hypothetical protein